MSRWSIREAVTTGHLFHARRDNYVLGSASEAVKTAVRVGGRVDLVLDGRVIVECDSREFHGGWERQQRDRERDLAAAALGYATLRPTAVQLFTRPSLFLNAARGLLGG